MLSQKWRMKLLLIFPEMFLHKNETYLQLFFEVYTPVICLSLLETLSFDDCESSGPRTRTGAALETSKTFQLGSY